MSQRNIPLAVVLGLGLAAGCAAAQTGAKPAAADKQAPTSAQCGQQALSQCTSQRVQELRRYREAMRRAANVTATDTIGVDEARRAGVYDRWLIDIANSADQIATRGQAALQVQGPNSMAPQVTFNEQYLAFMQRLRTESRQHDTSVGLMKRKHAVLLTMLTGGQ